MKTCTLFILATLIALTCVAQTPAGKVSTFTLHAKTLENTGGENPRRKVSVYLPPGYDQGSKRYPVIYFMHGFTGTDSISPGMKTILDRAIAQHKIRSFILVIANHHTLYEGSFYSNSSLTGNWSDFSGRELVAYVDKNYRTLANRDSRGVAGHSMGGYGAIKTGMLFPDVFSSVYALSPGLLAFVKEFGPGSDSFRELGRIRTQEELKKTYYPRVLVAVARAWSPNPAKPPFYCDLPFTYEGDSLVVNDDVLGKWQRNMPVHMVDEYASSLRKLKALKLDWGRNDASRFPLQCTMFSQRLENLGIDHFAEEYIGNHVNKIWTTDGRVLNDMLPFFNEYLTFD
jgi:S-formylglutathione hydrolase FrmB